VVTFEELMTTIEQCNPRAAQGLETPPGRPRHTWLRTLNADLHPLNHGLNSAWRLTQDRERWRQLVETAMLQPGARSWWWYDWAMQQ